MMSEYPDLITRFLRDDERLILSDEKEMPLVLEAIHQRSPEFLQQFLATKANKLIDDLAKYGALLFRGFEIDSDAKFEQTLLSIPQFQGIDGAFMAENGRDYVAGHRYVLMTNSVYKTGGTLYLGGFHTENYYSADVPGYLAFCCLEPSSLGGETGIINTEKIYNELDENLQARLEKDAFFVSDWLVSEVAKRYQLSTEQVEEVCEKFSLPRIGEGDNRLILMYKPSVFQHPLTQEKALQLNLFEIATLNDELRKCFMVDYQGKAWFWHRFFWKLPKFAFNLLEHLAIIPIAFFNSPKKSLQIVRNKIAKSKAHKKNNLNFSEQKVGHCFDEQAVKALAKSMRKHYSSCLWQRGDILLLDNKKVMHAGMPGKGPRLVRAMIGNPLAMDYLATGPGCLDYREQRPESIGAFLQSKAARKNQDLPIESV